jgi:hypothetical protein
MWEWDYISGNSAGALNALGVGLFEKGDETAMASALNEIWMNIKGDSTIFTLNLFPASLFYDSSIASNKPLRDYVTSFIEKYGGIKRHVEFGTSDLDTGDHVILTGSNVTEIAVE